MSIKLILPLFICSFMSVSASSYNNKLLIIPDTKETNIDFCSSCVTVVDTIKYYSSQNYTYTEIEKIITEGCSYLGPGYSQICNYIASYGAKYIIDFAKSLNSTSVCQKIKLCPTALDNAKCSYCKFIISQIETFILDDHTIDEIYKFINKLCNDKVHKYTTTCINILDYGLNNLVKLIKAKYSPDYVCVLLRAC